MIEWVPGILAMIIVGIVGYWAKTADSRIARMEADAAMLARIDERVSMLEKSVHKLDNKMDVLLFKVDGFQCPLYNIDRRE